MMFNIGDRVKSNLIGSWTFDKIGIITELNVISSDNIHGHLIKFEGVGVSVIGPQYLVEHD